MLNSSVKTGVKAIQMSTGLFQKFSFETGSISRLMAVIFSAPGPHEWGERNRPERRGAAPK
jgi:hypothetical protein